MEIVTVAATRSAFSLSDYQMLGSALVLALLAWVLSARMRRGRQPPSA
ncbi:MAG: hypothetical protein JO173_06245 [Gammaproteobacteria bacterium]|nr:hypothetical protein [Gammaproteobacteria bacterium]